MQFSSIVFATALVASVAAADYRELYKFNTASGAPCDQWTKACTSYKSSGLTYGAQLCQPGDSQGKNADSEAKVYCRFNDSNGSAVYVTKQVAKSIGATAA